MKAETDEFSSFLSQPNLSFEDVLLSSALIKELHAENANLLNYLQQNSIIAQIAEWCFTSKYKDNQKYDEISEKCVSAIFFSTLTMTQFLIKNEQFAEYLHNFLISDDSKNSRLCGYFSRILCEQIKWGIPLLFINYNDSQTLLLKRLDVLAICDLISSLVLSNIEIIDSRKMIEDLCILADKESDENAIYLLISIIKSSLLDSNSFLFENNTVLLHLINAAIHTNSLVSQSDLFYCIDQIGFSPEIINDQKIKEKLAINEHNINNLTISAIDILELPIENLVSLFFSKNSTEYLHQKILSKIELIPLDNLVEIANIPNFVSQIIEAFGTNSWCPHCMQFVVLFNKIKKNCKPMKSKKWKSFIHEKLRHYIRVLEHEYGGHVPTEYEENDEFSSDNNDIGIDENDDLNFEEEEEFYDNNKFSFEEDDPEIISKFNISDNDEGEEFNIDV